MPFEERVRLHLLISIRMTLQRLPWSLLTGAERGRRDRQEEERRLNEAAEACVQDLERGALEIKHRPPNGGHSTW